MGLIDNFKRDIARHRGRSAVLGVLFVTMILFSIRAVIQLQPVQAVSTFVPTAQSLPESKAPSGDAQAHLKESQELWAKLHEVKDGGAPTNVAFAFDPTLYPLPPVVDAPHKPSAAEADAVKPQVAPPSAGESEAARVARINDEAQRTLHLKSTAVGDGIAEPVAIVNQKLLTLNQEINGYKLTAIHSREVEFIKERVNVVIKMADGQ